MISKQVIIETILIENRKLAADTFLMRLLSPGFVAQAGQCIKVRAWSDGPFLDRPFSVHNIEDDGTMTVLYRVVGPATLLLSALKEGAKVKVTGPFGHGLPEAVEASETMYLVAGGIGLAPMRLAQKYLSADARLFYGERLSKFQVPCDWLASWGGDVTSACEEAGGYGLMGRITEPLEEALQQEARPIFACGPHPMLAAVSSLAEKYQVKAWVSVEARMACGFGICLTCSMPLKNGGRFRACQEGPVYDGTLIEWSLVK